MIDQRYRPPFLPQISMPYEIVLQKLDEEGVKYEIIEINPNENDDINPLQGITFGDEVEKANIDDNNPIWIAGDNNNICDGHHRYIFALSNNIPLKAVKIGLNEKDACRLLNKIQDIYEYEQSRGMEEVEMQGAINYYGGDENQFLNSLEEDNTNLNVSGDTGTNNKTVIGYRKDPIKENSVVGNFFMLKPVEGFDKYEIEFNNLLDLHSMGVTYKDGQEPLDIMAKIWFPNINFEKISEQYGMPSINLKNKAIAEKAMKLGYDGIKYGDTLIQGLK